MNRIGAISFLGATGAVFFGIALLLSGQGCGPTSATCDELNACDPCLDPLASAHFWWVCTDAGDGEVTPPPLPDSCDPATQSAEPGCEVTDEKGVFVSPSGSTEQDCGGMGKPCKSIQAGLKKGKSSGRRVYLCSNGATASEYNETVVIDSSLDGLQVYGGFDCNGWGYQGGQKSVIKPQGDGGIAFKVQGLVQGIELYDLAITSPNAVTAGQSSQAMWVWQSQNVKFTRLELKAGDGADGANAPLPTEANAKPGAPGNAGLAACTPGSHEGGAKVENKCGGTTVVSAGGKGGDGATDDGNGGDGNPGMPTIADWGLGGKGEDDSPCKGGDDGKPGDQGAKGKGASGPGLVSIDGWTGPQASAGADGTPGQGGGGGGGAKAPSDCGSAARTGASGGSGGAGGCGGKGGAIGHSGGASIALGSIGSWVTLVQCQLITGKGGAGGLGIRGQYKGLGGPGGSGVTSTTTVPTSCNGGKGGEGGLGGPGGGGAGGPSIGIVFQGTAPTAKEPSDAQMRLGVGGKAGPGGCDYAIGASIDATHCDASVGGAAGDAAERLEIPSSP